ncbi:MAG: hypothetical protein COC08_09620 [Maribacter sp.]|nr:MAG: hypothetical protein COC08_09620 [Maribacter sp.]
MPAPKKTFLERLKEGYEVAKKPIAYIIMFVALLLQTLPTDLMPKSVQGHTYMVMLLILALILMEILFTIYENSIKDKAKLNIIEAGELYDSILAIVLKEKNVTIKYIGVAGRIGWTNVITKLLNENNPDSLVANRTKFNVEIALLNPKTQNDDKDYKRFKTVNEISDQIKDAAEHLPAVSVPGCNLSLYHYTHMPNMLGFLVNDNYLFVTYAFWETLLGKMTLRAGGTDYFIYDKNDDFGGQEVIRRFNGWFNYISDPNDISIEDS